MGLAGHRHSSQSTVQQIPNVQQFKTVRPLRKPDFPTRTITCDTIAKVERSRTHVNNFDRLLELSNNPSIQKKGVVNDQTIINMNRNNHKERSTIRQSKYGRIRRG